MKLKEDHYNFQIFLTEFPTNEGKRSTQISQNINI